MRSRWRRSEVPACWRWKLPVVDYAAVDADDEDGQFDAWQLMARWQRDRCAICGKRMSRFVHDHDHETGLLRGFLCYSCNTLEAGGGDRYVAYRLANPASICGVIYQWAAPQPATPWTPEADDRIRRILDEARSAR